MTTEVPFEVGLNSIQQIVPGFDRSIIIIVLEQNGPRGTVVLFVRE